MCRNGRYVEEVFMSIMSLTQKEKTRQIKALCREEQARELLLKPMLSHTIQALRLKVRFVS